MYTTLQQKCHSDKKEKKKIKLPENAPKCQPPRPNQQKKHSKEKKKYHKFHLSSIIPHQPDNIFAMNNEKMVSHQRKKIMIPFRWREKTLMSCDRASPPSDPCEREKPMLSFLVIIIVPFNRPRLCSLLLKQ